LVDEVKKLDVGINVNGEKIGILLYADDVVFLLLYADDVVFLCEKENEIPVYKITSYDLHSQMSF
jgi:hypothetical protein